MNNLFSMLNKPKKQSLGDGIVGYQNGGSVYTQVPMYAQANPIDYNAETYFSTPNFNTEENQNRVSRMETDLAVARNENKQQAPSSPEALAFIQGNMGQPTGLNLLNQLISSGGPAQPPYRQEGQGGIDINRDINSSVPVSPESKQESPFLNNADTGAGNFLSNLGKGAGSLLNKFSNIPSSVYKGYTDIQRKDRLKTLSDFLVSSQGGVSESVLEALFPEEKSKPMQMGGPVYNYEEGGATSLDQALGNIGVNLTEDQLKLMQGYDIGTEERDIRVGGQRGLQKLTQNQMAQSAQSGFAGAGVSPMARQDIISDVESMQDKSRRAYQERVTGDIADLVARDANVNFGDSGVGNNVVFDQNVGGSRTNPDTGALEYWNGSTWVSSYTQAVEEGRSNYDAGMGDSFQT